MTPKNKDACIYNGKIKDYSVMNKFDDHLMIFYTKTEFFYSRIYVNLSIMSGSHGLFLATISPTKKQKPVDLIRALIPFLLATCNLKHIDSAVIDCNDVLIDVSTRIKTHKIVSPVFWSLNAAVEDCYVEVSPTSRLFTLRDEILSDEPLMRDTITYLSCSMIKRIFLGIWQRPWRK